MLNVNSWVHIILTGDFLGFNATGVEEDSPIVALALTLHTLLFG